MQRYSKIKAIEYYLPTTIIDNINLANHFNTTEEYIFKHTGIQTRYAVNKNEISSDIALKAAEELLNKHPEYRTQIDYLIFCSQSFDQPSPTTACTLQHKLNLRKEIGAIDVGLGCSGFMYCLSLAKALIESMQANNILILTAETLTKYLDPNDNTTRFLFGDAATATLVGTSDTQGIGNFVFGSDGSGAEVMYYKQNSFRYTTVEKSEEQLKYFRMNGMQVLGFSLKVVPQLIQQIIAKNNISEDLSNLDWIALHQASNIVLDALAKKLKFPNEKYLHSLSHFGNTVSSTIPITLKYNLDNAIIKENNSILLAAFGVGLSWCGTVIYL